MRHDYSTEQFQTFRQEVIILRSEESLILFAFSRCSMPVAVVIIVVVAVAVVVVVVVAVVVVAFGPCLCCRLLPCRRCCCCLSCSLKLSF
jgi:hypothetical protein